jgi:hypothetical protein
MPALLLVEALLRASREDRLGAERDLRSARRLADEMGMRGLRAELDRADRALER